MTATNNSTPITTATMTVDTSSLTDDQQDAFVEGWESAGGYMGDMDTPDPWCCPWHHTNSDITVTGTTPEEWGASWWAQCQHEVEALIAAEDEAEAEAEADDDDTDDE